MDHASLRMQRRTRDLSDALCLEYGPENAARMFEQAATEIRRAAVARATRPAGGSPALLRGMSRRV